MALNSSNKVAQTSPYWDLGEAEEVEAFCLASTLVIEGVKFGVLHSVRELKVLEIIHKRGPNNPLSAAEIAAELPTNNPEAAAVALGRMLDLLASYSVLIVTPITLPGGIVQRRYGLAPVCKFLIPDEHGGYLAPTSNVCMYKPMIESSLLLKDAVLEGVEPFKKAHGMGFYEYFAKQPKRQEDFNDGMSSSSILLLRELLKKYTGFKGIATLVDVGGGNGATLRAILAEYPSIKGINFDQPQVIANAPSCPGVEQVGGSIFEKIPKGDAMFMKWICHCFNDEACITILKNCYDALPEDHGKVIICEALLPDQSETTFNLAAKAAYQFDALMMATTGGRERTEKEFEVLVFAAGFQSFDVVCSVHNSKIMELIKKN
ncbi:caffeic acid 3-O-methyltransferase 2 [Beta vulgaris subsp. vulgaris]|uniref:caffeic acid 3-O-methyltransferase 2 n=1 Tax=Beta vulgaris subsp. vulgaris TaxID=3555 RepID=UPI002036B151|nr:caffeic acid 3-O-methyltransferase 2 [Beta vulgaris subsp. vulgaris]